MPYDRGVTKRRFAVEGGPVVTVPVVRLKEDGPVKRTTVLFIFSAGAVSDAVAHASLVQTLVIVTLEAAATGSCRQTINIDQR